MSQRVSQDDPPPPPAGKPGSTWRQVPSLLFRGPCLPAHSWVPGRVRRPASVNHPLGDPHQGTVSPPHDARPFPLVPQTPHRGLT